MSVYGKSTVVNDEASNSDTSARFVPTRTDIATRRCSDIAHCLTPASGCPILLLAPLAPVHVGRDRTGG